VKSFEYIAPREIKDVFKLLADFNKDAQILAGGTDLLIELRKPSATSPKMVVDISRLLELKELKNLVIG